jgi:RNA polymerase sigma-70 factor (ECF subfamily)
MLEYAVALGAYASPARREAATPDEQASSREDRQLLDRAIARLPRLYREVYVLGEVERVPNAEVALRLGLSVPAVKSRRHRAKMLLRRVLAPRCGGEAAGSRRKEEG